MWVAGYYSDRVQNQIKIMFIRYIKQGMINIKPRTVVTLGAGAAGNHAKGTRSIDYFLELK